MSSLAAEACGMQASASGRTARGFGATTHTSSPISRRTKTAFRYKPPPTESEGPAFAMLSSPLIRLPLRTGFQPPPFLRP